MSKKYLILNHNSNEDCTIFYILYIVLFFVIVFIIYKIIFNFNFYENYSSIYSKNSNLNKSTTDHFSNISSDNILEKLENQNLELSNIKNTLKTKIKDQIFATYISNNYDKIDPSSLDEELSTILYNFENTVFPQINIEDKNLIDNQIKLNQILSETSKMVNFYKPGDIVNSNSTFGITKNDICYRSNGKPIKNNSEIIQNYPNCMVCSVEDEKNLMDTNSWKHTKTNINKVCLYNSNAEENSGIPNLKQCKQFCNL